MLGVNVVHFFLIFHAKTTLGGGLNLKNMLKLDHFPDPEGSK